MILAPATSCRQRVHRDDLVASGDERPDEQAGVVYDEHVMMRRPEHVEAALAYYAEFTDEVDAQTEANRAAAEEAEEL